MALPCSRDEVLALDAADPLAGYRERFALPEGTIYLDGNSLGPPPRRALARLDEAAGAEWSGELIRAWVSRGWIELPAKVAAAIAPLIGAAPDEVAVADSISVNLFKLIAAALRIRPGRAVIVSEAENFPTDLYIVQGLADLLGDRCRLRLVNRPELGGALDDDVAVLMLTHVDFRTGFMHDLAAWTAAAHRAGALALWDLAHSAGAVPVDLAACGADLAVGCGYKYLNGGPGAPAFAYVARRHHAALRSPLWGWMGHAAPFDFTTAYEAAPGTARLLVGTPPVLGLAALSAGVESMADIGLERLRAKSVGLSELFLALVERDCGGHGLEIASPRDAERRGSHVALRHPQGYPIMQALIAGGVIGDFRAPDLLRFGLAPAYIRYVDVWDAVAALRRTLESRAWDRPEHRARRRVT